mmetsp:Transcript_10830/g.32638  ORF Transcript_10830/g.32638 Transcript_10830/m.32638 type:complete len:500 (+) Transcript_10830:2763-4262(+)
MTYASPVIDTDTPVSVQNVTSGALPFQFGEILNPTFHGKAVLSLKGMQKRPRDHNIVGMFMVSLMGIISRVIQACREGDQLKREMIVQAYDAKTAHKIFKWSDSFFSASDVIQAHFKDLLKKNPIWRQRSTQIIPLIPTAHKAALKIFPQSILQEGNKGTCDWWDYRDGGDSKVIEWNAKLTQMGRATIPHPGPPFVIRSLMHRHGPNAIAFYAPQQQVSQGMLIESVYAARKKLTADYQCNSHLRSVPRSSQGCLFLNTQGGISLLIAFMSPQLRDHRDIECLIIMIEAIQAHLLAQANGLQHLTLDKASIQAIKDLFKVFYPLACGLFSELKVGLTEAQIQLHGENVSKESTDMRDKLTSQVNLDIVTTNLFNSRFDYELLKPPPPASAPPAADPGAGEAKPSATPNASSPPAQAPAETKTSSSVTRKDVKTLVEQIATSLEKFCMERTTDLIQVLETRLKSVEVSNVTLQTKNLELETLSTSNQKLITQLVTRVEA